jgi:hypothetical protein
MTLRPCPYCQEQFTPSQYHPDQVVCSRPGCQCERRSEYHRQKGDREAGIDSVAESCGLMQSGHPQFETPRSAPVATGIPARVLQGLGDGDFHFLTTALQPKCL